MKRTLVVALLAATLTACGGTSSDDDKAKPTTAATTETTATAWTKEEAGRQYLAIVEDSNAELAKVSKATENPDSYTVVAAACKSAVPSLDDFMNGLSAGKWPTEVAADIRTLIAEVADQRAGLVQCAQASSADEVNVGLKHASDANKGAAQVVRAALGLPGTE